ncbi:Phosphatidylinositol transfer protein SEC14 and related proteins [Plasmopara halstedii]|uniref:Phosphatidylinositol transfer protein SEC14 and related proteins n=1 Tax=Plasmopara halstedii TaxID=4781 RepID=A0A0P1AI22_PLAHL|nr:Phosphatidylinositol transfer protein SEC14 and related proteins [Plasmopara halstedii]CEG40346.1 Phosphatidylinositol transfer protein SEC14 and related proteins [Plasmopara halstedii]|eukprot:XP_024576715.1 Phosphatidylinositol transfer protein SEC14 and related proteins [Plasmopara halstedii]
MSLQDNEENQPLSAEDQPLFEAVKAEFGDNCTDDLAIRVARAYRHVKKHRQQTTIAETRKILNARAAHDADNILRRDLPLSKLYNEHWPTYVYGEDSEGHLVTVDRISDINPDGLFRTFASINEIIPHRWQYMERIQWEKAAISKRLGRRVYKHVCVVDLKGLSMKLLSPSVLSQLKPIFDVGQLYYPETLHCLYVVNAPFIFYSFWKVISAIIQPETREKIQVFKDMKSFLEVAQNHGIPLTSLPSYMGGSHPGRAMNNTFTTSEPDTPLPVPAMVAKLNETTPLSLKVCKGT